MIQKRKILSIIIITLFVFMISSCIVINQDPLPGNDGELGQPGNPPPPDSGMFPEQNGDNSIPPDPSRSDQFFYDSDFPRPKYMPGELVDYFAQSGDILSALAARFNTTEEEIRKANPVIPSDATTLPQGFPMKIPIYYRSQWGSSFQILPDAMFVNSPAQIGFTARSFVDRQPGWFKYFIAYTREENRRGGEMVDYIAVTYSLSPRLLLALLEYQTGALSEKQRPDNINSSSVLGFTGSNYKPLSSQINRLSNYLNEMYYQYREGKKLEFELQDGSLFRIDPWQNAATAALQHYFADTLNPEQFYKAIGPNGFIRTYESLFGKIPPNIPDNIPGSLRQPKLLLPFEDGKSWALTGGPHPAWGDSAPYGALDFAPPSNASGCVYSDQWVLAPADGTIVRTDTGVAIFDLDGDHDERTGWNILFLHLLTNSIPPAGTELKTGDRIGHPSCDGGSATGTHFHIARKFNGEWIPAGGVIPFDLDGWIAENGSEPYLGYLKRYSSTVRACECSDFLSLIHTGPPLVPTQTPTSEPTP
ncbi:MAG: LysM peptidoglycan-binding domain-containing M23 family metallopeptidase [Flexilinea sp.]